MGSFKHPKVYDRMSIESIREIYYDILEELDGRVVFSVSEQRLKAAIIERLLDCATDGTPRDEWKIRVLSSDMVFSSPARFGKGHPSGALRAKSRS